MITTNTKPERQTDREIDRQRDQLIMMTNRGLAALSKSTSFTFNSIQFNPILFVVVVVLTSHREKARGERARESAPGQGGVPDDVGIINP